MDFILRFLNPRGLVLVGVFVALAVLAARFRAYPGRWYESRMIARDRGPAAYAPDISKDLDARESLRLQGLYARVSREIAAAKARGRAVGDLQRAADAALALNAPGTRAYAFDALNKLRLAIPQPLDALRPAGNDDQPSDGPPTPASAPAGRARAR